MAYSKQAVRQPGPKDRRLKGDDLPDYFMPAMPPVESLERFSAWLHSDSTRAAMRRMTSKLGIRWRRESKRPHRH